MKKIFLATCLLAASVFAAPQAAAPQAAPAKDAKAEPAKPAEQAAPAAEAKPAEQAAAPAAEAKAEEAAPAEQAAAPAAEAPAAEAPVAEAAPAEQVAAQEAAPAESEKPQVTEATIAANTDDQGFISAPDKNDQPKKKHSKKKKLVENAVITTEKAEFGILADFELSAGKVFWATEEDNNNDNFETWNGEANFAILAEGENFKGKLAVAFYPGDLKVGNYENKDAKQEALLKNENGKFGDYFSLKEAWAYQGNNLFNFKVGRWDNTDKNGDYFGGYVDGYLAGFLSTQAPENQLQLGITPNDNVDVSLALISKAENLDKGDLRAVFNFHDLEGINDLSIQLAYRSNLFDKIYNVHSDIEHNTSLKVNMPIFKNRMNVFAEAAMLNFVDDMVIPVTGGFLFQTKVVDRIIIEAEYISDRASYEDKFGNTKGQAHIKDVLGALYLEKAFTDRFSLSASLHSFGSTKDVMLSGNLIGRIN